MSSEQAAQSDIHDAQTKLSRIIDQIEHGEEVVISRAGNPVAKAMPFTRRVFRTARGSLQGKLGTADDWDSPDVGEGIAMDFGLAP